MSRTRWSELEQRYARLLDLDAEQRERELATLAPDLAHELRALLEAGERAESLFDSPPHDAAGPENALVAPPAQRRVGAYELVSALGSGSMGAVYRARRVDGIFEREVAIKFLYAQLDVEAQRHFSDEAQALARLDHPHVVSLLDAGVFEGGPYLVLECVDGVDLGAHLERTRANLAQRIRLVRGVAGAVAAAHRQLVLHLDIKPSNVIVGGDGKAKLVDFGVAGLIGRVSAGPRPFTPGYASPEQVRGECPTTASDVYALGRLLEFVLPHAVPLDLRAVVARATAPDAELRYESAERFDDELARYERGEELLARPLGASARAWRWMRRNPLVCSALALALGSLALSLSIALDNLRMARANEALGWRAHAQALHFAGFLERALLNTAEDPELLSRLEAAAAASFAEWAELPEAVGRTREALARAHAREGNRAQALAHVDAALQLARTDPGFDSNDLSRLERLRASLGP